MMQIINSHVHMIEVEKALKGLPKSALSKDITMFQDVDKMLGLLKIEILFSQMERAGVAKSVLFACDAPVIYASNEYVAGLCSKYPDRLIGFASVDPHKKNAADIIESAIKDLGLKGIKFHPPLQKFYPNDKMLFPVYKKAVELNVPVVFHVGTTPFGAMVRLDQANPILLDEVACEFPEMKIILTHLGTLWHNEAFMVAEKNPNVYLDTAAYIYEIKQLLTKDTIDRIGHKKFIFGTDYPTSYGEGVHNMKEFVDCINSLDLPSDIKERIFYKNFQELLLGG